MTGPAIVIPMSGGGAVTAPNNYNYTCTANPADPECYLSCFGKFQYTPPPGTVQMGQDGRRQVFRRPRPRARRRC